MSPPQGGCCSNGASRAPIPGATARWPISRRWPGTSPASGRSTLLSSTAPAGPWRNAKALRISDIALSATGTAANIGKVRFGPTPATMMAFTTIVPAGRQAFGGAVLQGGTLARGNVFTIYWAETIDAPVSITAAFATSAIPLPAALPLLAGALGALGLARRKAKKAA